MGEKKLGELELLVLLAILRLGHGEAHPVSIVDEIQGQTGRAALRATVYVVLQRLEEKGLVTSRLGDPVAERGGRPRRLVSIEPEGVQRVKATRDGLIRMWGDLDDVLDHV